MPTTEDPTVLLDDDPDLYEALMEGYDAQTQGRGYDASPYDGQTPSTEHRLWLAGFRASRRDEIRHHLHLRAAAGDVYGIKVRAPDGDRVCAFCKMEDEGVYTLEEALETPPIPHEHCKDGECRCTYVLINDRHHPGLRREDSGDLRGARRAGRAGDLAEHGDQHQNPDGP